MTEKDKLLLRNLLGPIFNLAIIYSQWWAISMRNKYITLTIISVKILLSTSLTRFNNLLNHFGTGTW